MICTRIALLAGTSFALAFCASARSAPVNTTPLWKSYQQTGNPADIIASPTVATALGTKIDAVNGQSQGQLLTAPSLSGGTINTTDLSAGSVKVGSATNSVSPSQAFARLAIYPDDYKTAADGTDDAPSIQRAINAATQSGGNLVRFMPHGYTLASGVTISSKIDWECASAQEDPNRIAGTYFRITNATALPVTVTGSLSRGTKIHGCAWYQNQPNPGPASWVPNVYQPIISILNTYGAVYINDNYMPGIYQGINVYNAGRVFIDGLWGQWFNYAIQIDKSYDIDRISNLHAWPYWSADQYIVSYQQSNLNTIMLRRADGVEFGAGMFGFAENSMLWLGDSKTDSSGNIGGPSTKTQIPYLTCDFTRHCILVEAQGTTANIGTIDSQGQDLTAVKPLAGADTFAIDTSGSFNGAINQINQQFGDKAVISDASTSDVSHILVGSIRTDLAYTSQKTFAVWLANSASAVLAMSSQPYFTNIPAATTTVYRGGVGTYSMPVQQDSDGNTITGNLALTGNLTLKYLNPTLGAACPNTGAIGIGDTIMAVCNSSKVWAGVKLATQ